MLTTGVVAEFNPFHNGHKYLIQYLKERGDRVVCVIGDDFTQRGDVAVISKYKRAEAALRCGADLCVLLPVQWSMSCANNFAFGAMSLLKNLGFIDSVAFGSECGDINKLFSVCDALENEKFPSLLAAELKKGITFAAARQNALKAIIGNNAEIVSSANDTLGIEYISACRSLGFSPTFTAVKRVGGMHDSEKPNGTFLSASSIRDRLKDGIESIVDFVPDDVFSILKKEKIDGHLHFASYLEGAMLSHLRRMTAAEIANLPEISEGLENRVFQASKKASSVEECLELIKTKRYTLSRIRRILFYAFLNIDKTFFLKEVPYIKVLGFNDTGRKLISSAQTSLSLLVRGSDYLKLEDEAKRCFETQNCAADIYALSCESRLPCGGELTAGIIKV